MKPPTADLARLVERHPEFSLGVWRNLLVPVWLSRTTVFAAQKAIAQSEKLIRSYPEGIVMLTLIGNDAGKPDAAAVKLLAEHMSSIAGHIKHSAVVFEGTGFRAAFIRAVTTGLSLLANHPYPHRMCEFDTAVEDVARAMSQAKGTPVLAVSVRRAVQDIRRDALSAAQHQLRSVS
jgi:hypothetical protein